MNADETPVPHSGDQAGGTGKASPDLTGHPDGDGVSGQNLMVQRVVSFSQIAGGTTEVIIEHEGQQYRLRATRNGRLLLNK